MTKCSQDDQRLADQPAISPAAKLSPVANSDARLLDDEAWEAALDDAESNAYYCGQVPRNERDNSRYAEMRGDWEAGCAALRADRAARIEQVEALERKYSDLNDIIQADIGAVLRALDLFDGARPISAHQILLDVIVPEIRQRIGHQMRVFDEIQAARAADREAMEAAVRNLEARCEPATAGALESVMYAVAYRLRARLDADATGGE